MQKNLSPVIALAIFLFSGSAWSQIEQKLVIEPENPDSNDLITISVTNSACYGVSEVRVKPDNQFVNIILSIFESQCQSVDPNDPDFETTIGPLPVGDWTVWFTQMLNGSLPRIADIKNFSVTEAQPVSSLAEGGINGLYYSPEADGHYVYILETDFTTLIVWTTFDAEGNQVWVYGTGELENGKSVMVETYINRNEGHSPEGEFTPSEAEHWGWMDVDMSSCLEGTFTFQSDFPEFGSGQFPIKRLGFVKQLGCIGID